MVHCLLGIFGEHGHNSKLKLRKRSKFNVNREIWRPVQETGRFVRYPDDSQIISEE